MEQQGCFDDACNGYLDDKALANHLIDTEGRKVQMQVS